MRKIGGIFLTIIELLSFLSGYIIQYFTERRMGMARYVIYKNQSWQREYPLELWKICILILILLLTIMVFVLCIKRWGRITKITRIENSFMLVMTAAYISFILVKSTESMRAYYFIGLILAVIAVIQIIKAFAAILTDPGGGKIDNEKKN
jgi:hypothetical protein